MRTKIACVCFIVSLLSPRASGQFASAAMQREGDIVKMRFGEAGDAVLPIVGYPYSAERTVEVTNTLVNGSRVTSPQSDERIWRDSQGRTRSERQAFRSLDARFVYVVIIDPVACLTYVIDDISKTAHRVAIPRCHAPAASVAKLDSVPQTPAAINTVSKVPAESSSSGLPYLYEMLGSRNFSGVIASGTRTTTTIPAGAIGNSRPIVTIDEMWSSKLYEGEILSTSTGGPNGDITKRLINIVLGEPDPSQFRPPVGYTVVDEKGSFTINVRERN